MCKSYMGFLLLAAVVTGAPVKLEGDLGFEENKGQFRPGVLYGLRPSAYLTANAVVLAPEQVFIRFDGANPSPVIEAVDPTPYTVNVFSGSDPSKWITGIRRFRQIRYSSVYPGIDMVVAPAIAYRFVVSPGANPSVIRLRFEGALVTLGPFGGTTVGIWLKEGRSGQSVIAYQDGPNGRTSVDAQYTQIETGLFGVSVTSYDSARPLTVEFLKSVGAPAPNAPWPTLAVARSGALYGAGLESALVTAAAPEGEICGETPVGAPWPCSDVALYKYLPTGELAYISYLRGSGREAPSAVVVDDAELVWVAGPTESADLPVTQDAIQKTYAGGPGAPYPHAMDGSISGDAFLARIDGATGALTYSSYIGGPDADSINALRLDSAGNVYAGGSAGSGLPVTPGAFRSKPCVVAGSTSQCILGFLAKVDPDGRLSYLTYLPGEPQVFDVDPAGNAYFAGSSTGDLPRIPGAYRTEPDGPRDLFVAKLISTGTALGYATYYPAGDDAYFQSIAADKQGNVWFQAMDKEFLLAKISADGSRLLYSQKPFIDGRLHADPDGNLNIATFISDSPYARTVRTSGGLLTEMCGSVTLSKLDPDGVVLANRGMPGVLQPVFTNDGSVLNRTYTPNGVFWDVVPIEAAPLPDVACAADAASLRHITKVVPGQIITLLGRGLKGASVSFDGSAVPVLYADESQVNAIAPYSLQTGATSEVKLRAQDRSVPVPLDPVAASQPSLFTLDGSGAGHLLALNADGTINGMDHPVHAGATVSLFVNGMGKINPAGVAGAIATGQSQPLEPLSLAVYAGYPAPYPVEILRASTIPGLLNSIIQVDVRLPVADIRFPPAEWSFSLNGTTPQLANIVVAP